MHKTYKTVCLFLCTVLLFSSFSVAVFAETKHGRITKDKVHMRDKSTTEESKVLDTLSKDTVVTINGKTEGKEAEQGGGKTWYNISYEGKTGYVYGKYIEEIASPEYDKNFEKNLLNFPKSYQSALRKIHDTYPNWIFIADKVDISLDTAINYEYSPSKLSLTKKWVELTYGIEWRDARVDTGNKMHVLESRWTYASREAIAFFMDPRNALVVKNEKSSYPNIFTFLQQSYDADTQTEEGLRTVIAGTFLEKGYGGNKDKYISDIIEAAKESGVSPYVIASIIKIEQGVNGTSSLISGKYEGYEGYYNFFNYGAYGDDVVKNGLEYAKKKKWKSRKSAIKGGAKLYAEGYINKGQDTYYYMDFDVKSKGERQYAVSVYDQCVKAVSIRSVCTENKNAAMTFKIPVYSVLPSAVYKAPTIEDYFNNVSSETEENESESSIGSSSTDSGGNDSSINSSKKSGDSAESNVSSDKNESGGNFGKADGSEPLSSDREKEQKKGDVDGDEKVNGRDLAVIKLNLLGLKKLEEKQNKAADVSGDGKVNGRDLAIVKMHLLGLRKL